MAKNLEKLPTIDCSAFVLEVVLRMSLRIVLITASIVRVENSRLFQPRTWSVLYSKPRLQSAAHSELCQPRLHKYSGRWSGTHPSELVEVIMFGAEKQAVNPGVSQNRAQN